MSDNSPSPPDPIILATKILEIITATWIDADQFDELINYIHAQPGAEKVDCTQRLIALIKRLPPSIVNKEIREKIVEAGREYLDAAITEEEDLEEAEESE